MQQLIGILIFCAVVLILVAAGIYFGRGQKPRSEHYGSWSNIIGPFSGQGMDIGERLNREIEAGQHGGNRRSRRRSS